MLLGGNKNARDFIFLSNCVVPENIHTPPTEGIGNSGEEGGVWKSHKFKAMYETKLEFPKGWGGGGGGHRANPLCGGYGYFLEPHITICIFKLNLENDLHHFFF